MLLAGCLFDDGRGEIEIDLRCWEVPTKKRSDVLYVTRYVLCRGMTQGPADRLLTLLGVAEVTGPGGRLA